MAMSINNRVGALTLMLARRLPWRAAAVVDSVAASRLDARALCRRLTLAGWSHLDAAESRGRGVVLASAGFGSWQLAALAIALYRGPVDTAGDWRRDAGFRRLAESFERRSDRRLFRELEALKVIPGARVGVLVDRPAAAGDAVDIPFLGGTLRAGIGVARAALAAGAPLVPVFGHPVPDGWRVEARPPLEPEGDEETLTARCLETVEREIRQRPELRLAEPRFG